MKKYLGLISAIVILSNQPAQAQYPDRTINIVVGYSPGGSADVIARIAAKGLSDKLAQSVIVENKPGTNGGIAAVSVRESSPDGYTLIAANTASMVLGPAAASGSTQSYNAAEFSTIARIGYLPPLVLVVNKDVPVTTIAEFVAYLKRTDTSYGINGPLHKLVSASFLDQLGNGAVCVTYRSDPQTIQGLLSKSLQWSFIHLNSVLSFIEHGDLRALMVLDTARTPRLPQVPTAQEAGFAQVNVPASWFGIMAPKNVPPAVVATLSGALKSAVIRPEIKAQLETQYVTISYGDPDELRSTIQREQKAYAEMVSRFGAKDLCGQQ